MEVDAGKAWIEFSVALADAADALGRADVELGGLDEIDRAEGLRFLARLTRSALRNLEPPGDPMRPVFRPFGPPDVTFGIPNPDNLYQSAPIDPTRTYRLTGRRNTVHFFGLGAQRAFGRGAAAEPGRSSHLDGRELVTEPDGAFEIVVSPTRPAGYQGNWIELTPDARTIMVRQTFLDRAKEVAAELAIECLDPVEVPPPSRLAIDAVARELARAAEQVTRLTQFWIDWVRGFGDHADVNQFFLFDEATHLAIGGDPQVRTPLARWRLADDEALVIDLRPPECEYWNIQLATLWTEPIDPRAAPTCLNSASAIATSDGRYPMVVANRDPGVPNWLDAGRHHQGLLSVRWVRAAALPLPSCRVIKVDEVPTSVDIA